MCVSWFSDFPSVVQDIALVIGNASSLAGLGQISGRSIYLHQQKNILGYSNRSKHPRGKMGRENKASDDKATWRFLMSFSIFRTEMGISE